MELYKAREWINRIKRGYRVDKTGRLEQVAGGHVTCDKCDKHVNRA